MALDDTAVTRWVLRRVWNDRELKGGVMQFIVGAWMAIFAGSYHENVVLLPSSWYVLLTIAAGLTRIALASVRRKRFAAFAVLGSCFAWGLGIANVIARGEPWRLLVVFFAFQLYESVMSFVRLWAIADEQEGPRA